MNATTFQSPLKDFDPTTAPASTLLQYGYPRRPDSQKEPGFRALWDRAMARKPNFVPAQLVEDKVWRSRPPAL
jgi:hypothetical protein